MKELFESWRKFIKEEYEDLDPKTFKHYDQYHGRNIIWLGEKEIMFKANKYNATSIYGNTFEDKKVQEVVDKIEYAEEKVVFYAPYGTATIINLNDVKESIEDPNDLELTIMGEIQEQLTTGDEELDDFLVNPDNYDRKQQKYLKQQLKKAVENLEGDLGTVMVQIRDGNHRARGALLSGEPYIWVRIVDFEEYSEEQKELIKKYLY